MKYPMFEVFDQPDATLSCERRDVTTVPTQALTLFNNEFFLGMLVLMCDNIDRCFEQ